jgi:hypothetical protein
LLKALLRCFQNRRVEVQVELKEMVYRVQYQLQPMRYYSTGVDDIAVSYPFVKCRTNQYSTGS